MRQTARTFRGQQSFPIPVWSGLLEHCRQIGAAIWVFLWALDKITVEFCGVGFVFGKRPVPAQEIAIVLNFHERTVRRHIKHLSTVGYLLAEETGRGFILCVPNSAKFNIWRRDSSEPKPLVVKGNGVQKAEAQGQLDDGFAAFWDAYPRRVAKPAAERAWRKVRPEEIAALMAGLEKHKHSQQWTRDGGRFIPHPATWLNGRRWEDEVLDGTFSHARRRTENNLRSAGIVN